MNVDPKDGGFYSRKMIMAYITMAMVTFGYLATGFFPALNVSYGDFCMALLTAAGIYAGGNTASKLIISKHLQATQSKKTDPPDQS